MVPLRGPHVCLITSIIPSSPFKLTIHLTLTSSRLSFLVFSFFFLRHPFTRNTRRHPLVLPHTTTSLEHDPLHHLQPHRLPPTLPSICHYRSSTTYFARFVAELRQSENAVNFIVVKRDANLTRSSQALQKFSSSPPLPHPLLCLCIPFFFFSLFKSYIHLYDPTKGFNFHGVLCLGVIYFIDYKKEKMIIIIVKCP